MSASTNQTRALLTATGGSLVVCIVTPTSIYLSADSRYADAAPALRNSARKLLACGPTALCGLSGLLRFTRTEYEGPGEHITSESTFELAQIIESLDTAALDADGFAADGLAADEPRLSAAFTQRLQQALAPVWERFAMQLDAPFGFAQAAHRVGTRLPLAQLFYGNRLASGGVYLSTIDLGHTVHRSESGQYDSVLALPVVRTVFHGMVRRPRIFVRGKRACARVQPLPAPVEGDAAALRIIHGIFAAARHGARCAAVVGGPVDIAAVDASGRRWLKKKDRKPVGVASTARKETFAPHELVSCL